MLSKYKYHFILHFTIIIWGFTGVLGKHLDVSGMESMPIVVYRMFIGWTTLLIFMFLIKQSIKIDFKGLLKTLGTGVIIAAHWWAFFKAIELSNVSIALIFMSTTALFTSFVEPIIAKKKFDLKELLMGVMVGLGISVIIYDLYSIENHEREKLELVNMIDDINDHPRASKEWDKMSSKHLGKDEGLVNIDMKVIKKATKEAKVLVEKYNIKKASDKVGWSKANHDLRKRILLTEIDDPDEAEMYINIDWKDLPTELRESINEKKKNYMWSIILALISAFLAAVFSIINSVLVKEYNSKVITLYEIFGGFVAISTATICTGNYGLEAFNISLYQFSLLFVLGSICTSFAFLMGVYVMKFIPAYTVNLSVNMEPIYAIVLALVFFGSEEVMSLNFYIGSAIVVGTILLNAYFKRTKKLNKKKATN